ncbi:MAG: diguanylate cyclase [Actinomycetota bacterium]
MAEHEPTHNTTHDEMDFRALVGVIPDPVLVVDGAVNLKYVNQAGVDLLGWDPKDWIGRPMFDMIHPDDIPVVVSSTGTVQGKRAGTPIEIRVRRADGGWTWVEFVGSDAQVVVGVEGIVVVVRDITQRRMWEVAGGDTAMFQQLVQHGSSVTLLLDADGRVTSVNAAFNRLLGHDPSLMVDRTLSSFCVPGQEHLLTSALQRCREFGLATAVEVEMRHVDPDAESRPLRFEIVNLLDDPVVAGFIVTGHDVSDLHRARQSLEHLARHDALTGLANRSVLLERIEQIVDAHQPAAAVFIDLDRFKPVNDLFGHEAGDELLRQVADRLRLIVRADDLVARVGGDEFVVLVVGVDDRSLAQAFCDRIDAALAEPYLLAEGPARVTASVGLSLTAGDSTVTGLLADAAVRGCLLNVEVNTATLPDSPACAELRGGAQSVAAGLARLVKVTEGAA